MAKNDLGKSASQFKADGIPSKYRRHQRKIITTHVYPPIPSRQFDWVAHYEGDDETGEYGYGETEAMAIADLAMTYGEENKP